MTTWTVLDTMNGDQAESYIRKRAAVEESIMQLRLKYIPIFRKVLSGPRDRTVFPDRLETRSNDRPAVGEDAHDRSLTRSEQSGMA